MDSKQWTVGGGQWTVGSGQYRILPLCPHRLCTYTWLKRCGDRQETAV
ncbi:MAG: hypothetical protein M5U34_30950 [Chloroflexi bacterium]|nr:hypothetical protein [Chloroflexota bacterium]